MKHFFLFTTIIALMVSFFAFANDGGVEKADTKSNTESSKLRVIMSSDFPPIGVVKGGDDVPNTMKSDPDVRFRYHD